MSFTIQDVTKRDTSYEKRMKITHEAESYSVLLHWDTYDGYELTFYDKNNNEIEWPKWAEDYDNATRDLHSDLDSMSDEIIEAA